jgi:hypothetical protein
MYWCLLVNFKFKVTYQFYPHVCFESIHRRVTLYTCIDEKITSFISGLRFFYRVFLGYVRVSPLNPHALSFIWPKWFWTMQIVLDGYKLFRSDPNYFGQVYIRFFWTNFYNFDLSIMNIMYISSYRFFPNFHSI